MAPTRRSPRPAFSLATLLLMGLGAMAILSALIWLALAYEQSALLAVLLPILPVVFSFFVEQCRNTMEELREDADEPPTAPTSQGGA